MNRRIIILVILILQVLVVFPQDSTLHIETDFGFKGQLSSWGHVNVGNPYPLYLGARYIPQLNYEIRFKNQGMLDFETSANLVGDLGVHFWDSVDADADINPYRLWGRYSNEQIEFRVGMQKIDFGTAQMLRALRWFDQVDPRDPLQLTDGVYAALFRYYFLNNTNIWLWGLYGNKNTKGMEVIKSNQDIPEFGGRIQFTVPLGEVGMSYHHRMAETRSLGGMVPVFDKIPENRIGIDGKWDLIVGLWFEGAYTRKEKDLGVLTNQEVFTLGSDYTFPVGAGLGVGLEHMFFASDENAFEFTSANNNTALSIRYPIGMFDNIQAIVYYDWKNNQVYNFVNWFRSYDFTTFYLMAYWNPENATMPNGGGQNLYSGKGIQFMFVFNH